MFPVMVDVAAVLRRKHEHLPASLEPGTCHVALVAGTDRLPLWNPRHQLPARGQKQGGGRPSLIALPVPQEVGHLVQVC